MVTLLQSFLYKHTSGNLKPEQHNLRSYRWPQNILESYRWARIYTFSRQKCRIYTFLRLKSCNCPIWQCLVCAFTVKGWVLTPKKRVNRDKTDFATKLRMFGPLIIDEGPSLSRTAGPAVPHFMLLCSLLIDFDDRKYGCIQLQTLRT